MGGINSVTRPYKLVFLCFYLHLLYENMSPSQIMGGNVSFLPNYSESPWRFQQGVSRMHVKHFFWVALRTCSLFPLCCGFLWCFCGCQGWDAQSTMLLLQSPMPSKEQTLPMQLKKTNPLKSGVPSHVSGRDSVWGQYPSLPFLPSGSSYLTNGGQVVCTQQQVSLGWGWGTAISDCKAQSMEPRSQGKFLDAVPFSSPSSKPTYREIGGSTKVERWTWAWVDCLMIFPQLLSQSFWPGQAWYSGRGGTYSATGILVSQPGCLHFFLKFCHAMSSWGLRWPSKYTRNFWKSCLSFRGSLFLLLGQA